MSIIITTISFNTTEDLRGETIAKPEIWTAEKNMKNLKELLYAHNFSSQVLIFTWTTKLYYI